MIILPYAFLMNTSENKNRVVEHGWSSVLKNVSRKSGETMLSGGDQAIKDSHSKQSKRPYNKEKREIFATSSSAKSEVTYKKVCISPNVSFEFEPCSSKGHKDTTIIHHTDITNRITLHKRVFFQSLLSLKNPICAIRHLIFRQSNQRSRQLLCIRLDVLLQHSQFPN